MKKAPRLIPRAFPKFTSHEISQDEGHPYFAEYKDSCKHVMPQQIEKFVHNLKFTTYKKN